jgi:type II secretory ATPase GspE/PulE/Tfp pilus assembly ATPase PilB-like protein
MGIDPYLVASSLEVVLAQRLVRRICPHCKEEFAPPPTLDLRAEFGDDAPHRFYRGAGCRNCQSSGYRGRTCIMELMQVTEGVRALILRRASGGEIRHQTGREGMRTLRDDGWRHVIEGHTTIDEVLRVTKDERAEVEATAPSLPPNGSEREGTVAFQRSAGAS